MRPAILTNSGKGQNVELKIKTMKYEVAETNQKTVYTHPNYYD